MFYLTSRPYCDLYKFILFCLSIYAVSISQRARFLVFRRCKVRHKKTAEKRYGLEVQRVETFRNSLKLLETKTRNFRPQKA